MSKSGTPWSDLGPRFVTAVVLVVLGGIGIWLGSPVYTLLLFLALLGVLWELGTIVLRDEMRPKGLLILSGAFIFASAIFPLGIAITLASLTIVALMYFRPRKKTIFLALGGAAIAISVTFLDQLRGMEFGLAMTIWLIGVVAFSDVGAYFTGRIVGGAKLWPSVSPGKTRSGAMGGVAWALIFGTIFALVSGANLGYVVVFSILLSVASMAGDLAQSAVKRHFGVKDSGKLLPGHGGLWDRFDGVIGAALVAQLLAVFTGFPEVFW